MVMVLSLSTAFAATITITPPDNTTAGFENTYTVLKIFDAVANGNTFTYHLMSGKDAVPANTSFVKDDAGNIYHGTLADSDNASITTDFPIIVSGATKYLTPVDSLTDAELSALASYGVSVGTIKTTGTTAGSLSNVDPGYYYISTTTGTLVIVNTTDINIKDKNTVPTLNKKITSASGTIQADDPATTALDEAGKAAISQIGTSVGYTSTITVGKGMKNYVYHDTMSTGLTFNNDVSISYSAKPDGYVSPTAVVDASNSNSFTLTFPDGLAEGTVITITYSAKVNKDALTYEPENNTAYLSYGNAPTQDKTPDEVTHSYSAKISVLKKDGAGAPLEGAGFKLYKFDTDGTTKLYYHLVDTSTPHTVSWGAKADGDQHVSAATTGIVPAFLGLNDGTYYLEETQTPSGYNTAPDTQIVINGTDYTQENLEKAATVVNNAGSTLPSTGGIGTTIFYIVGAVLVLGAAAVILARRKAEQE